MNDQPRTGRITGVWYLLLAVTGGVSFMVLRPAIHVPGDAAKTLANVVEHGGLARLGLTLELAAVASQALVGAWFYRLFRDTNSFAAACIGAFGLVNAIALLGSAVCMATAIAVGHDGSLAPGGDAKATVQLLYTASANVWSVGALFFGLWLIPMGVAARSSKAMPPALGWTLIVGGGGYVASALVGALVEGAPRALLDGLTLPASVGEFWMVGFLLFVGWRPRA